MEFLQDLTFDESVPQWVGVVRLGGMQLSLYFNAGESGPDDRQLENLDQFIDHHEEILERVRKRTAEELRGKEIRGKEIIGDSFSPGLLFIFEEAQDYLVRLDGDVLVKGRIFRKRVEWTAYIVNREIVDFDID